MAVLVLADHKDGGITQPTRSTVAAAAKLGEVHVLLVGEGAAAAAPAAAKIAGVAKVLTGAEAPVLAEPLAALLVAMAPGYSHLLAPASAAGKNVMPRVAALLDVQVLSDISGVIDADTFVRPIYAGNALETIQSGDAKKVITVRPTAFEAAGDGGSASVETVTGADAPRTDFVSEEMVKSDRPELAAAKIVVSGGRAMGSAEEFAAVMDPLADKLGAAVGASRAAVDAGYAPNDYQVGQTGKVVAPQLYIAIGISGAIQHLAGMKDSKVIVAINKDPEAPIFQIADYGWVADYKTAVPELMKALG